MKGVLLHNSSRLWRFGHHTPRPVFPSLPPWPLSNPLHRRTTPGRSPPSPPAKLTLSLSQVRCAHLTSSLRICFLLFSLNMERCFAGCRGWEGVLVGEREHGQAGHGEGLRWACACSPRFWFEGEGDGRGVGSGSAAQVRRDCRRRLSQPCIGRFLLTYHWL